MKSKSHNSAETLPKRKINVRRWISAEVLQQSLSLACSQFSSNYEGSGDILPWDPGSRSGGEWCGLDLHVRFQF